MFMSCLLPQTAVIALLVTSHESYPVKRLCDMQHFILDDSIVDSFQDSVIFLVGWLLVLIVSFLSQRFQLSTLAFLCPYYY